MSDPQVSNSRRREFAIVLIVLALNGTLVGCGGEVISAGNATVLVGQQSSGGDDALGGGTLEIIGGCLGASGSVIVWPNGTKVANKDPLTIKIPDKGKFSVGDEVQVPGGYVQEQTSGNTEAGPYKVAGITVPAECAEHDIFVARRGH